MLGFRRRFFYRVNSNSCDLCFCRPLLLALATLVSALSYALASFSVSVSAAGESAGWFLFCWITGIINWIWIENFGLYKK